MFRHSLRQPEPPALLFRDIPDDMGVVSKKCWDLAATCDADIFWELTSKEFSLRD